MGPYSSLPISHLLTTMTRSRWLLILLFVFLYGLDLALPRDLWVQDEARYGEVVREMVTEGDWLVPHLNGYPYPDKPALYFWLVAGVGAVVGHGEFAFRLVTFASTAAAAVGVYLVALQLLGGSAAFWAGAAFLTAFLTLVVGHIMRMDMLLTVAGVYAWYSLLCWRAKASAAQERQERGGELAAFWVFTALGLMVKGPIALLFTLLPAFIWSAWEDGPRGVRALRPVTGVLMLLALVGSWIGAVAMAGEGAYLSRIWHEQLVGRAVSSWSHREPLWFYLVLLPLLVMPWAALLPIGVRHLYREQSSVLRSTVSFTLPPLVSLSLLSGKLFLYLEPLFPGLAVIAGAAAALRLVGGERVAPAVGWSPVLFFGLLAIGVGYGADRYLDAERQAGLAIAVALLVAAGVAAVVARAPGRYWLGTHLTLAVVFSWVVFGVLITLMTPLYSGRALGEYLAHELPATVPVGIVNTTRGVLNYYAGRIFVELNSGEANAWRAAHPGAALIVPKSVLSDVFGPTGIPGDCRIHRAFTVEMKEYHVVADC
ncbi:4-amino-4-deoxy-L-arabinose transferase [Gammaproteobacteria bacterium]